MEYLRVRLIVSKLEGVFRFESGKPPYKSKTQIMEPNLPTGETMSEGSDIPPAGDSLDAPAETSAKTFSVPVDVLPDAKPGDIFKVQSVADGNVMLEHQDAEGGDDWGDGLKKAAPRVEEGAMV